MTEMDAKRRVLIVSFLDLSKKRIVGRPGNAEAVVVANF